jgi:hypothetical protein
MAGFGVVSTLAAVEGEHRLDHAGDAGGAFEVADVGLDRADEAGVVRGASRAVHGGQRLRLERVAQPGPGPVRLDVVDRGGRDARLPAGPGHHVFLGRPARGHDAVGVPVLVHGAADDEGEDPVAVAPRVGQPLEHDHAAALAAPVAVGRGVERLGPPVGGQGSGGAEREGLARGDQQVDAAGEGDVALAEPQALRGQVQRDQRRRAGGVDGHAGAAQVQGVGDAVGDGAGGGADPGPRLDLGQVLQQAAAVVGRADPDEHPGVGAGQLVRRQAGVLQRLPRGLHQDALLRVHQLGLAGRQAEELRVEALDVAQEAAVTYGVAQRGGVLGAVVLVGAPAFGGQRPGRVPGSAQQVPECVR